MPLYILQWTRMPSILLETHFGSNAGDHAAAVRHAPEIADAIAAGVEKTLETT